MAPLLGRVGTEAGDMEFQDDGMVTTRSMAAAVAMGLGKMCSHCEKIRLEVMRREWSS